MADDAAPADERSGPSYRLDDVMLAMDVVDTLRHREDLVARELDEERREAELIARLRQIYRGQGIEVPDRVLADGVAALKESRFVYTPPEPSLAVWLARLWVSRVRVGQTVLAILAVLVLTFAVYDWFVRRPLREIAGALETTHAAFAQASAPARERADRLLAEGRQAVERGDAEQARAALGNLEAFRDELPRAYHLRIVAEISRPVRTALHRRDYFLIVEAVAPDGGILTLQVRGADGELRMVNRWGIRVPEETYISVESDRREDGVLQGDRLGEKRAGEPNVDYTMPVLGDTITEW
jgi:hypothetical protein